jgi:hypothetical protein
LCANGTEGTGERRPCTGFWEVEAATGPTSLGRVTLIVHVGIGRNFSSNATTRPSGRRNSAAPKRQAPNASQKTFGAPPVSFHFRFHSYFGITSRANLLATTSRISLRFFPASIMASREP